VCKSKMYKALRLASGLVVWGEGILTYEI
jgi:hypothetical protein